MQAYEPRKGQGGQHDQLADQPGALGPDAIDQDAHEHAHHRARKHGHGHHHAFLGRGQSEVLGDVDAQRP
jgi:ribosomal protein RSM22 (predicted rRNA methylase)